MAASELPLRTRQTAAAVFWSWFLSVRTLFGLPTGSIATFSTGCPLPTSSLSVVSLSDVDFGPLLAAFGGVSSIFVTLSPPDMRPAGSARQVVCVSDAVGTLLRGSMNSPLTHLSGPKRITLSSFHRSELGRELVHETRLGRMLALQLSRVRRQVVELLGLGGPLYIDIWWLVEGIPSRLRSHGWTL